MPKDKFTQEDLDQALVGRWVMLVLFLFFVGILLACVRYVSTLHNPWHFGTFAMLLVLMTLAIICFYHAVKFHIDVQIVREWKRLRTWAYRGCSRDDSKKEPYWYFPLN